MVCVSLLTVKLCDTDGAAAYVLLPACDAVMVQVPPPMSAADEPETVHTLAVADLNVTARPELAVAERPIVEFATWVPVIAGKVIVWLFSTTKLVPTAGAAA
jgi:hypothetical protein